jgi:hypothetical protein
MMHLVTLALVLTLYEVGVETAFAVAEPPRAPAKGTQGPDTRATLVPRVPAGPGTR